MPQGDSRRYTEQNLLKGIQYTKHFQKTVTPRFLLAVSAQSKVQRTNVYQRGARRQRHDPPIQRKFTKRKKHRKGPSTYLSGFSPLSELKNEFNLWLWSKLFLSFLWLFLSVHFSQEAIIKLGFITNWKAGKDRPLKNESSKTHHSLS